MPVELPAPAQVTPDKAGERQGFVITGKHVLFSMLAFFGVIIAVNMTMIVLALRTMPGTNVKSAYEASQRFNAELDTISQQDGRRWQVDVVTADIRSEGVVRVFVRDAAGEPLVNLDGLVKFERPTDMRFDTAIDLTVDGAGRYVGRLPKLASGQWDVTIDFGRGGKRLYRSHRRVMIKD